MPITYTNRKGITSFLCRGSTKTGKPRYSFARRPNDDMVEQLPVRAVVTAALPALLDSYWMHRGGRQD